MHSVLVTAIEHGLMNMVWSKVHRIVITADQPVMNTCSVSPPAAWGIAGSASSSTIEGLWAVGVIAGRMLLPFVTPHFRRSLVQWLWTHGCKPWIGIRWLGSMCEKCVHPWWLFSCSLHWFAYLRNFCSWWHLISFRLWLLFSWSGTNKLLIIITITIHWTMRFLRIVSWVEVLSQAIQKWGVRVRYCSCV